MSRTSKVRSGAFGGTDQRPLADWLVDLQLQSGVVIPPEVSEKWEGPELLQRRVFW